MPIRPSDILLPPSKRKTRPSDNAKKRRAAKSTNKGKNLSVWFREDEKSEVEAYAEKALEKPGPLARRVVLLYVRGKLVPRES
jgi:hypothetical protein